MTNPELVNAVGGGTLPQELQLSSLYEMLDGEEVRYDPEYWPGLYLRFAVDSPAVLVFRTGKYNVAGADSLQGLHDANDTFLTCIEELGINTQNPQFEVRNLVYLDTYGKELELDQAVVTLGLENAEYEPEQFPGILYRPPDGIGTFLIFGNGKVLLTGAATDEIVDDAFTTLFAALDEAFI